MKERKYLVLAQEAEAFADASDEVMKRETWESIAREYRKLVQTEVELRQIECAP
jgi:hypothetical protein